MYCPSPISLVCVCEQVRSIFRMRQFWPRPLSPSDSALTFPGCIEMAPKRKGLMALAGAKRKAASTFGSKLTAAQKKQQQQFEDATEGRNNAINAKARMDINTILDAHPDKTVHFLYLLQAELSMAPKRAESEDDPSFINQTTTLSKVPQSWLLQFLPTLEPTLDDELFSNAYDLDHSIAHRAACLAFCVGADFRMKVLKYRPIFKRYMRARYAEFGNRLKHFLSDWSPAGNNGKYPWHLRCVYSLQPVWNGMATDHKYTDLKHISGLMAKLPDGFGPEWVLADNWLEEQASLTNEDGSQTLKCWQYFKAMPGFILNRTIDIQATGQEIADAIASLQNRSERLPAIKLEREFELASKKARVTPAAKGAASSCVSAPPPPPPAGDGKKRGELPAPMPA